MITKPRLSETHGASWVRLRTRNGSAIGGTLAIGLDEIDFQGGLGAQGPARGLPMLR